MNASGKWRVRQTQDARRDKADIVRWTIRTFGPQQAQIYAETIALALQALSDGPDTLGARQCDDIAPGVFTLHVARNGRKGRHFVVFRVNGDQIIDVLRLLHDSMDLERRLAD
ncbi:MAG: type II toxin-antitoxin system RelE/ParE family toxin [Proteobacteria bacterium]|nr:type II toxin-antitoxin system RelE/ParE family toxin [Pseudomonadota bacterium]MBS0494540.1 type II toxin-antitoxin system RelE/ParE family toxin [Pseudomonadota bacterium]